LASQPGSPDAPSGSPQVVQVSEDCIEAATALPPRRQYLTKSKAAANSTLGRPRKPLGMCGQPSKHSQLTPGFRAAPLLPLPLPFDILCSCGILAKEYILVSILGFACMVFYYCLHRLVIYSIVVLLCCFGLSGALFIASRFGSFSASFSLVEVYFPLLVLFAGFTFYCWLVASGFWLLGPLLWALWEFFPSEKPVLDSGCLVVVAWMLLWCCLCRPVFLLV